MQIKAAVLEKVDGLVSKRTLKLEDMELEAPRAGEVRVRITSCGVCGTDRGCIHGNEPTPTPCILGHEGAGIIEEVGAEVTRFQTGDRGDHGFPVLRALPPMRAGAAALLCPLAGAAL